MKAAILVCRVLLGLMFFVFGLNNILHFIPMTPPPGVAGEYMGILAASRYLTFVAVLQIIGGLLLLVGRFVPLGLTILAPIIVNILCFHFLLAHEGYAAGLLAAVLELFLIWAYRFSFRGLFDAAPEVS